MVVVIKHFDPNLHFLECLLATVHSSILQDNGKQISVSVSKALSCNYSSSLYHVVSNHQ